MEYFSDAYNSLQQHQCQHQVLQIHGLIEGINK